MPLLVSRLSLEKGAPPNLSKMEASGPRGPDHSASKRMPRTRSFRRDGAGRRGFAAITTKIAREAMVPGHITIATAPAMAKPNAAAAVHGYPPPSHVDLARISFDFLNTFPYPPPMTMTRDQLRAARMLLRLKQDTLAKMSQVGTATIRRFETGSEIRTPQLEAITKALDKAGIIFVQGSIPPEKPRLGVGVVLLPKDELPATTRDRIALEEARDAERIEAQRRALASDEPAKPRGRPKKSAD